MSEPGESALQPIDGNTRGLKASQKKSLERLYRRRTMPEEVVSLPMARHLAEISRELRRQVGVLVGRDGVVQRVIVGDAGQLMIPEIGRLRGGVGRFRGLRLVHTHIKGESLTADDLNDLALLRLDAVAVVQADEDGGPGSVEVAHLDPAAIAADAETMPANGNGLFVRESAARIDLLEIDFEATMQALESELARRLGAAAGAGDVERVLVIGVGEDDATFEETLALVRSTDVELAGTMRQKRRQLHPGTIVGRGKLQEIVLESMRRGAEVAIFDVDLRPAQARGFEDETGLKAVDRTQLILDVFARRARSRDGKLQVELAQLKYALPRLTEKDAGLSRLAGGIGGRGPGETALEISRRRTRDRIRRLEKEIESLSRQRDVRRRRRRDRGVPILSIVGYTNAGKSTLLNAMTNSEVAAADQLFMTLDPTSRRLRFPREGEVVITDTVGFIADLPPDLLSAFRATLEELADATLLLHVIDASDPRREQKTAAVEALLEELGLTATPRLEVFNKVDLVEPAERARLARGEGVMVSARSREGLEELMAAAEHALGADLARASLPD